MPLGSQIFNFSVLLLTAGLPWLQTGTGESSEIMQYEGTFTVSHATTKQEILYTNPIIGNYPVHI